MKASSLLILLLVSSATLQQAQVKGCVSWNAKKGTCDICYRRQVSTHGCGPLLPSKNENKNKFKQISRSNIITNHIKTWEPSIFWSLSSPPPPPSSSRPKSPVALNGSSSWTPVANVTGDQWQATATVLCSLLLTLAVLTSRLARRLGASNANMAKDSTKIPSASHSTSSTVLSGVFAHENPLVRPAEMVNIQILMAASVVLSLPEQSKTVSGGLVISPISLALTAEQDMPLLMTGRRAFL